MPVEREFVSPDFCRLGTLLACAEMIRGGVTCFADMYYFEDAVATATAEAGMRALCAQTVLKFPTPDAASFEEFAGRRPRFHRALARSSADPVPSVGPARPLHLHARDPARLHRPGDRVRRPAAHPPGGDGSQRSKHGAKSTACRSSRGSRRSGLLEAKVLAAHCVHVDEGEIRTLAHADVGVAHNPSSNLKLASGFAPVSGDAGGRAERRASAPTGRPPTTISTCSRRCVWRASSPRASAATRRPCRPDRPSGHGDSPGGAGDALSAT